jgi:hypothetical protein
MTAHHRARPTFRTRARTLVENKSGRAPHCRAFHWEGGFKEALTKNGRSLKLSKSADKVIVATTTTFGVSHK